MIRVTAQDGISTVSPAESLDLEAITELQRVLEKAAEDGAVVVDLSGVRMLS